MSSTESHLPDVVTERLREDREGVEHVAERDDTLGATARCLLAWHDGEHPPAAVLRASHFDAGSDRLEHVALGQPTPSDAEAVRATRLVLDAVES